MIWMFAGDLGLWKRFSFILVWYIMSNVTNVYINIIFTAHQKSQWPANGFVPKWVRARNKQTATNQNKYNVFCLEISSPDDEYFPSIFQSKSLLCHVTISQRSHHTTVHIWAIVIKKKFFLLCDHAARTLCVIPGSGKSSNQAMSVDSQKPLQGQRTSLYTQKKRKKNKNSEMTKLQSG